MSAATSCDTSSWTSKISSRDLSHLFDQTCWPSFVSTRLAVILTLLPPFRMLPSTMYSAPNCFAIAEYLRSIPLKLNDELLEITGKDFHDERFPIISSVTPSAKYSCSSSLLIFLNGSTAIVGGALSSFVGLSMSFSEDRLSTPSIAISKACTTVFFTF